MIFFIILASLMYIEGLLASLFFTIALKPSKVIGTSLVLFWPIALPIIFYIAYKKFKPILDTIKDNPFFNLNNQAQPVQFNFDPQIFEKMQTEVTNPLLTLLEDQMKGETSHNQISIYEEKK